MCIDFGFYPKKQKLSKKPKIMYMQNVKQIENAKTDSANSRSSSVFHKKINK